MASDQRLVETLIPAIVDAGRVILEIRARGHSLGSKADESPVTDADHAAEAIILAAIRAATPHIPIIAEEEVAAGRIPEVGATFMAVDALDGTRDFVAGGADFTVNIGLIRDGSPIAGLVGAPALSRLWTGVVGLGADCIDLSGEEPSRQQIHVRRPPDDGILIVASRLHRTPETDDFISRFPASKVTAAGSSLKLIKIAEGEADLYPRMAPTSQWDIAAGDAILTAAGGSVVDMTGEPLAYGPRHGQAPHPFINPWFVATGGLDPFG